MLERATQSQSSSSASTSSSTLEPLNQESKITLTEENQKKCNNSIKAVQKLIYALGFEEEPKEKIEWHTSMFMIQAAFIFAGSLINAASEQKIEVEEGPKNTGMHEVLKAAIQSLKELNPKILQAAKEKYAHEYDVVKTKLAGIKSLNDSSYTSFATFFGTVNNQPGALVNKEIKRVEALLKELCPEHTLQYSPS